MKHKIIALISIAVTAVILFSGCGAKPDPIPCAKTFFDAYIEGDNEAASPIVGGYAAFDLSGADDSEYHALMNGLLRDNFSYELGSANISGSTAQVEAQLTFFDFRKLSEPLEEAITQEATARMGTGEQFGSKEEVISLLCEMVRSETVDPTPYLSTETVTVDMRASGDGWIIVPDDALLEILMGYAG